MSHGMKLAVLNTKGGVGKTTTSVYLAAVLVAVHGVAVDLIDTDPQGGLTRWLSQAGELKAGVRALVGNAATLEHVGHEGAWAIIDTAPGYSETITAAITAADLVIIPTKPDGESIDRAKVTAAAVASAGKPYAVLLVDVDERELVAKNSREALDGAVTMFDTTIPARTAIMRAKGTWPTEWHGYDAVVAEVMDEMEVSA